MGRMSDRAEVILRIANWIEKVAGKECPNGAMAEFSED
jgi:hypothetical protein